MGDCIKFSGKLLTRYYTMGHEGLCCFYLDDAMREQINTMKAIAEVGQPFIKGFNSISIKAYLPDSIETVYFLPNQKPQFFSSEESFVKSFDKGQIFWNLDVFDFKKVKLKNQIPIEALYINVSITHFWICSIAYENSYNINKSFTSSIPLSEIGL